MWFDDQVRNSVMSIWLLIRQWLTDNLSPMNLLVRVLPPANSGNCCGALAPSDQHLTDACMSPQKHHKEQHHGGGGAAAMCVRVRVCVCVCALCMQSCSLCCMRQ